MNKTQYRTIRRFARDNGDAYALRHAEAVTGNPFASMLYKWVMNEAKEVDALAERKHEVQKWKTSAKVAIKLWPTS